MLPWVTLFEMMVEYGLSPLRWHVGNDGRYLTGTATAYCVNSASLVLSCNIHLHGRGHRKELGRVRSQALPVAPWYPLFVARQQGLNCT